MTVIKYTLTTGLILALLIISGCTEDISPKAEALKNQLNLLKNDGRPWILESTSGSVVKDGFDVSDQFAGFKLSLGDKTYTTQNGLSPVWETSGTWNFQGDNPNLILRGDGLVISVSLLNNNMTLTFTAEGSPSGGRTNSISGEYNFHLVGE